MEAGAGGWMGRKTPPSEVYPEWTQARYWGFIRSALRQAFNRYPPKYESIKEAAEVQQDGVYKTGPKKGQPKMVKRYRCAECDNLFLQKEVQVDHIIGAGSLRGYVDLPGFVSRLFCSKEDLQVLCKPCHHIKTQQEKTT